MPLTRLLLGCYALVNRTPWRRSRLGRWAFRRAYFLYKRHCEDAYYALGQSHPELFRGGHVLDVGANIGYTTCTFAPLMDPGYRVHAFEPDLDNYQQLQESIQACHLDGRAVAIRAAVGASDGEVDLWLNQAHHGDHRIVTDRFRQSGIELSSTARVPLMSIDRYAAREGISSGVAFIKIDVQGYEPAVCRGMEQTLAASADAVVAMEYSPDHMRVLGFQPQDALTFFVERKFRVYSLRRGQALLPLEASGIEAAVRSKDAYIDLILTRRALT